MPWGGRCERPARRARYSSLWRDGRAARPRGQDLVDTIQHRRGNQVSGEQQARDVTQLLDAWQAGDLTARDHLLEELYDQMRALAAGQLRRHRAGVSIQPTELVHELFIKLEKGGRYQDRGHFLALCATAMRHILIDAAKLRRAQKRGGGQRPVTLEEALLPGDSDIERVLAVDQALGRLRDIDERLVQVVECRFFSGLSDAETAKALGVSTRTVSRDWIRARAWLTKTLGRSVDAPEADD